MIARTWRGWTTVADMEAYSAYLNQTGLKEYRSTSGNVAVFALRRIVDDRAEFLLITFWESEEAMQAFSGPESTIAVFYPEDDRYLVDRETWTDHFEVFFAGGGG